MTKHAHYGTEFITGNHKVVVHDHADPTSVSLFPDHSSFSNIHHTVVCDEACSESVGLTVDGLNAVLEVLTEYGLEASYQYLLAADRGNVERSNDALALSLAASYAVSVIVEHAQVPVTRADLSVIADRVQARR